jgi:hypothetical protein
VLKRLTRELSELRHLRGSALVVLTVGCIVGLLLGRVAGGGASPAHAQREATAPVLDLNKITQASRLDGSGNPASGSPSAPPAGPSGGAPREEALKRALRAGVVRVKQLYGGTAEAAAWVVGDGAPVWSGDAVTPHRMWSMSKAVTAVTLEREASGKIDAGTQEALTDAITRSDNCAQRAVIVRLQDLTGGPTGALASFENTLDAVGAHLRKEPSQSTLRGDGELQCASYVRRHASRADGTALQLGTAEWNLLDVIEFAHGLADDTYGAAGEPVLALMRQPKALPLINVPGQLTEPLDWGAGETFAGLHPAYKGGWGGHLQRQYMAGQMVVVDIAGKRVALAAIYHPAVQPSDDDPGKTHAREALDAMFRAARSGLR